jgi:hypothetical protein
MAKEHPMRRFLKDTLAAIVFLIILLLILAPLGVTHQFAGLGIELPVSIDFAHAHPYLVIGLIGVIAITPFVIVAMVAAVFIGVIRRWQERTESRKLP